MAEEQQHVLKKRNDMVYEEEHRPLISKRKNTSSSQDETKVATSKSISSNIPPDHILFEILLLLPVKSLLRCKSVCKLWLTIISDPGFVAAHLDRAKTSPKLAVLPLVRSVDRDITVYSYEEGSRRADFLFMKEFNILQESLLTKWLYSNIGALDPSTRLAVPQHSNGLFLLETVAELSVFNPSTRQVVTLPPVDSRALVTNMACAYGYGIMERAGFGFDSYSGVYKVARYVNRYACPEENRKKIDLGFEVFTLGVDSSWRVIDDAPYRFSAIQSPVSVGGGIYYLIPRKKISLDSLLLRFDVGDEEFTILPSPPLVTPIRFTRFYMAEMEGILVLSTFQWGKETEKMDMWKLVEGRTWVHSFSIDILFSRNVGPSGFRPVGMRQGKLLLQIIEKKNKDALLAFYDPHTKSVEKTVRLAKDLAYYNHNYVPRYFREDRCSLFQVVSYVESLVSWETNHKEKN